MYSLDPVAGAIVCGSFALLFGIAAVHKLRTLPKFTATLAGYLLLPAIMETPISVLVPVLEALVAVGLLIGPTREAASAVGAGLLMVYAAAMGLNLQRGRRQLECGCLGPHGGGVISAALVWRNVLMAIVLLSAGCVRWSVRPLGWLDIGTIFAAVGALALLYAASSGLLALAARHDPRRG